jgi:hypothetical protein
MDWARITFGVSNHTLQLDETCGGNKWVALAMDPQIHVEKMFDSMALVIESHLFFKDYVPEITFPD